MRYHSFVQELANRVLRTVREQQLLKPGDRVAAAVSGGADSVALLLLLLELRPELGIVLSVAHANHKLRGPESEEDEHFVADLARQHGLDFHVQALPVQSREDGIEAAARQLRYGFFRQLMAGKVASKIATGHTLDDQAETVLLRMLRGTGIRGLSGIHPRLPLSHEGRTVGEVVRPLLSFHRRELEPVLRGWQWREDSSNRDPGFDRNRVRHAVVPLLKNEFGEGAVDNLAALAEIARAEEEHWQAGHPELRALGDAIVVAELLRLPLAAQRRLTKLWLERSAPESRVTFRLIEDMLDAARGPAGRTLELSAGSIVRRTQRELVVETRPESVPDYEYELTVPGKVEIAELGLQIEAVKADAGSLSGLSNDQWLDAARVPGKLVVRNWRAGDRFWPAHSSAPKKVKEILSDRHLSGLQKKLWPVVEAQGFGLVWLRGFPTPQNLQPRSGSEVLWIREAAGPAPVEPR